MNEISEHDDGIVRFRNFQYHDIVFNDGKKVLPVPIQFDLSNPASGFPGGKITD